MNIEFSSMRIKPWSINDTHIVLNNGKIVTFDQITNVRLQNTSDSPLILGEIWITVDGKDTILLFPYKQREEGEKVYKFLLENYGTEERKAKYKEQVKISDNGIIYKIQGARGRTITIYEDRCIIAVTVGLGSILTGNVSDGEKTIYYSDCLGVQFKEAGLQLGYLQLETASRSMNNINNNFFNENSFTFDSTTISNDKMREVKNYIQEQIRKYKEIKSAPVIQNVSVADELKKFKELLDLGIITQEEFAKKKKELLGF